MEQSEFRSSRYLPGLLTGGVQMWPLTEAEADPSGAAINGEVQAQQTRSGTWWHRRRDAPVSGLREVKTNGVWSAVLLPLGMNTGEFGPE